MKKIINLTDSDYKIIEGIITKEGLSSYLIRKEDFICYKDNRKIIAFGRIFNIGGNDYELSGLYINEDYRGKKLGIEIISDLLKNKFNYENNLFLACKRELEKYYEVAGFNYIEENIPEKLKVTLKRGKENNFDAIIMKYNK
ncbi:MAG: GNAT family N-acetyltransferase [Candidatus Gracilibacteria bacterium]|nr:GNAT family N-acetyltransferase [Candidatus Gracilibacteria bacterium]